MHLLCVYLCIIAISYDCSLTAVSPCCPILPSHDLQLVSFSTYARHGLEMPHCDHWVLKTKDILCCPCMRWGHINSYPITFVAQRKQHLDNPHVIVSSVLLQLYLIEPCTAVQSQSKDYLFTPAWTCAQSVYSLAGFGYVHECVTHSLGMRHVAYVEWKFPCEGVLLSPNHSQSNPGSKSTPNTLLGQPVLQIWDRDMPIRESYITFFTLGARIRSAERKPHFKDMFELLCQASWESLYLRDDNGVNVMEHMETVRSRFGHAVFPSMQLYDAHPSFAISLFRFCKQFLAHSLGTGLDLQIVSWYFAIFCK